MEDSAEQGEHATMEWGIFRKGDTETIVPCENLTYRTREAAEEVRKRSSLNPSAWEARGREIGPWDVKARDAGVSMQRSQA